VRPAASLHRQPLIDSPLRLLGTVLLIALAASSGATASDESELDGLLIVRIVCERYNIFDTSDPKTSKWPYRAANAVHIRSRERFIRSMLLFDEGDAYSIADAAESARLLRALGIMNPVEISAHEVEGGVEVTVETHDQWSLQVGADAGLSGNRGTFGFQIQEENLMGWGKELSLGFDSDVERNTWIYGYIDPNIFDTRWTTELVYQDRTDGFLKRIRVGRPFYSLETHTAWAGWWESEELTEHLYSAGESVVQGRRTSRFLRGWYGIELGNSGPITRRLTVGWDVQQTNYDDWHWVETGDPYPSPQPLDVSGIRVGYEQVANNYEVLYGFRAWSSQEDVGLGPNFRIGATFSGPALGDDISQVLFDGLFSVGSHSGRWLLMGDAWLSGRFDRSEPRDVLLGIQLAASQIGPRGFQFRLLLDASHKLQLDRQLALGADVGLRGWDPDYFDGTSRALVNAQWRTIVFRDVLRLFSVGVVVFADAGKTWNPRVGFDTGGIRTDAGAGLLFDLSRLSMSNVLRVEVAWPDDRSGPVVTLTGSALF
jgi:hypothetical protein